MGKGFRASKGKVEVGATERQTLPIKISVKGVRISQSHTKHPIKQGNKDSERGREGRGKREKIDPWQPLPTAKHLKKKKREREGRVKEKREEKKIKGGKRKIHPEP